MDYDSLDPITNISLAYPSTDDQQEIMEKGWEPVYFDYNRKCRADIYRNKLGKNPDDRYCYVAISRARGSQPIVDVIPVESRIVFGDVSGLPVGYESEGRSITGHSATLSKLKKGVKHVHFGVKRAYDPEQQPLVAIEGAAYRSNRDRDRDSTEIKREITQEGTER